MPRILCLLCLWLPAWAAAQPTAPPPTAADSIRAVLVAQQDAWNRADLDAFMAHYWRSDSVAFVGRRGVTYGWQRVYDNYRRGYPDAAAMGQLRFQIHSIRSTGPGHAWVLGQFFLTRNGQDGGSGWFTLQFQRIGGRWVITADHTSG